MPELLNAVTATESITTYDRSYAGGYDNPFSGLPSLTFKMQRVTVRDRDQKLLATEDLPDVLEPFQPGKVYELRNPVTGDIVPGQTFTAEFGQAVLYSIMVSAVAGHAS